MRKHPTKKCPDCGRKADARSKRCRKCFPKSMEIPVTIRFWKYVNKTSGCWIWTGGKIGTGYGGIQIGDSVRSAHRISWEMHYGPIPKGMLVCHKCDNPPCVRPDHLFIGTHQDNMSDMVNKGRSPKCYGEFGPTHKLSNKLVKEIRSLYIPKYGEGIKLARRFKMSTTTISSIVRRKTWSHI